MTDVDLDAFARDGYVILRGLASADECQALRHVAEQHLASQMAPMEYEVDVQYPGAPADPDGEGGRTSRRLLQAYSRHDLFREWATGERIGGVLAQLFSSPEVMLSQCHHNCVMTKQPGFSSVTL